MFKLNNKSHHLDGKKYLYYNKNASEIRTQKIVNGVITNFYLNGDKILAQDMHSSTTGVNLNVVYTYGTQGVPGFKFLYKRNILGDILGIYDDQGVELVKYLYDAWGNHAVVDVNGNVITDETHNCNINPLCSKYELHNVIVLRRHK